MSISFTLQATSFKNIVSNTVTCLDKSITYRDDPDEMYTSVYFEATGPDTLQVVGLAHALLTIQRLEFNEVVFTPKQHARFPGKDLLQKISSIKGNVDLDVTIDDTKIFLTSTDFSLQQEAIDEEKKGTYRNYRQILPAPDDEGSSAAVSGGFMQQLMSIKSPFQVKRYQDGPCIEMFIAGERRPLRFFSREVYQPTAGNLLTEWQWAALLMPVRRDGLVFKGNLDQFIEYKEVSE